MALAPCAAEAGAAFEWCSACVLQRRGRWAAITPRLNGDRSGDSCLSDHGAGPLASGKMAIGELTRLPARDARPRGGRFSFAVGGAQGGAGVILDGQRASVRGPFYDVRMSGGGACIESVTAWLAPELPAAEGDHTGPLGSWACAPRASTERPP
ncbi:hypothetical protein [Sorangium sp. So ce887]|uniref:hypothetical protein n=1 Tax=Sorangium sp. So ce887 TaxID=3133324 RepID=UPI003F611390